LCFWLCLFSWRCGLAVLGVTSSVLAAWLRCLALCGGRATTLAIVDGPPVNWGHDGFECVAAGRAGGKTYAVFIREAWAGYPTGDPFKSGAERDLCFCAKIWIVPCIFIVKPLVLIAHSGIFVVDVEEGVGYLSIGYWVRPFELNHSHFIFGGDGVYLVDGLVAEVGVKREIGGPFLKGCAYRVKVKLEPEKLTISQPLYNVTSRAVRVG
jgi:hypothetical protein